MVENRPLTALLTHFVLVLGVIAIALPIWITFVAATHDQFRMNQVPLPLWPGTHLWDNLKQTLFGSGLSGSEGAPVWLMLFNSLAMAMMIALGKIAISLLSAFAIVYFRFPFRMTCFWMIFITLMLPVEVRILPTFEVVANLGMLNSYWGLSIPLIASATATFMFRQVFLTVPDEMLESARIDGAGPMRFFWDILLPLSRTNIAALFVILFIFGWNQYLWPLLITTDPEMNTIVMGIKQMFPSGDDVADWPVIMATSILAMVPPVIVVVSMQKLFIRGLVDSEK
jgi:sn-glycerol 3-phosphate transport system permease protein